MASAVFDRHFTIGPSTSPYRRHRPSPALDPYGNATTIFYRKLSSPPPPYFFFFQPFHHHIASRIVIIAYPSPHSIVPFTIHHFQTLSSTFFISLRLQPPARPFTVHCIHPGARLHRRHRLATTSSSFHRHRSAVVAHHHLHSPSSHPSAPSHPVTHRFAHRLSVLYINLHPSNWNSSSRHTDKSTIFHHQSSPFVFVDGPTAHHHPTYHSPALFTASSGVITFLTHFCRWRGNALFIFFIIIFQHHHRPPQDIYCPSWPRLTGVCIAADQLTRLSSPPSAFASSLTSPSITRHRRQRQVRPGHQHRALTPTGNNNQHRVNNNTVTHNIAFCIVTS